MKYINQKLYPHIPYITRTEMEGDDLERGKTTTISSSGCGLCSAIMVADRLLPNCEFDLDAALAIAYAVKANHKAGTDYSRFAPAFAEKLGLKLETSKEQEDLRRCLRTGGAAVVHVTGRKAGQGLFTRGGHYMAVISQEPDGRFAILDPSCSEEKYAATDRVGRVEIVRDVIVLCDGPTLHNEVTVAATPYYLFWRK